MIFHSRDNCLLHHLLHSTNNVPWQIILRILRSVLGRYVDLITHSTLYAICHTSYPRLAPRRVHSMISRATACLTWRGAWVRIMPRSKHFLFASCGPQIPFTWRNAYWGFRVEPTRSWKVISSFHPCQAFSYGHLGWNLIQLSTGHVSFPFPSILLLQKNTV